MYGTVARFRALPGRRNDLSSLFDDKPVPVVPGWIANYLYALDDDPNSAILVSVFDNRESYHANAASPEQHQRYLGVRALLADEPEWNDGEMSPYMSFREPAADSKPYGSVSRLTMKHGQRPALDAYMEAATARLDEVPGMLAGYLVFLLAVIGVAIWSAGEAEEMLGGADHRTIVVDEVAGMLVAGAFVPGTWLAAGIAFLLFRVFDIVKPFPANVFDGQMEGGIGVVGDDLVAGAYAGMLTWVMLRWL